MNEYAVDTNVFIEAANRYYRFDMPPGRWFWDLLDRAVDAGIVHSAQMMHEELKPANDQLTAWATGFGTNLWIPPNAQILAETKNQVQWAQQRVQGGPTDLLQAAVDEYARGDVFLIATAAARGSVVVTHESSSPASRKRIMIPDACSAAGIDCVDPWTMLADLDDRLGEK